MPSETAAQRRPSRASVRTRILRWVVLLTALGALLSGTLSYLLQRDAVRDRVDDGLLQEVEELRQFAAEGADPSGGRPFATVEELVRGNLQRNVPNANEAFVALVDDQVVLGPNRGRAFRPDRDPEFLEVLDAARPGQPVQPRSLDIDGREVRYVAVPVTMAGTDSRGVYAVAVDIEAELDEVDAAALRTAAIEVLTLAVVALAGWVVAGRVLEPLRLLRDTAQRISDTDLSRRIPLSGRDELAELARTFNDMLDRLEAGAGAQRQFLDDAAHELRTPLTILRGHLDVLDPADEAQVAESRELLLDEVDRMSRLVNDLVLLARARRPDFVVAEPVHVGNLLRGALARADALGPRLWLLDAAPDVVVHADPQRLTQALVQLASNAVKFSSPRDVVALGGEVRGDELRLWVRDTGPGIDPADHSRILERFGRAATGVGVEGSGLGLAIVSAIAEGHGGRVEVDSRIGRGARFTLVLPLSGPSTPRARPDADLEHLRPWERA